MISITEIAVRNVITTSLTDISTQILMAETVVNESLTNSENSNQRLILITVYLAAHFISIQDPRPKNEKLGDASATYQGETSIGYSSSLYGKTALSLDVSGILARSQKPSATLICA